MRRNAVQIPTSPSIIFRFLRSNRDRGEPHGSSPPTPPGIRITYQAVRLISLPHSKAAGCSVRLDKHSLCSPSYGPPPHLRAGVMSTPQSAYYPSQPFGPSSRGVTTRPICCPAFRLWGASIALPASELLCPLLTSPGRSKPVARLPVLSDNREISRGKTQNLPCVSAGFIKHTPTADGGLRGHVPARPGCTTPRIRFLFVAPHLRIGLPSDPVSRRRPCPSPCLRLRDNLA